MTLDKSLKIRKGMLRSRSVLSRGERLTQLKDSDRWSEGDSPLGLPKVRVYKLSMKKKKKKAAEEGAEGAAAAPAGDKKAAAGKPAAGAAAKPAAKPAAAAKAAPAKKK
jgi:small basic protein (TIGR04137 family)